MCDKENTLKDILKQIIQYKSNKYKGLLECLEDNAKTMEQCLNLFEDKNIKAVYECLENKEVLVEMANVLAIICLPSNASSNIDKSLENIIHDHLIAYIKQWTEMQVKTKDGKTIYARPPYVITKGTGFVEKNNNLKKYIKFISKEYADKHNNKNNDYYRYVDAYTGKATPGVIKEILNPENLTNYLTNHKKKNLGKKIEEMKAPNQFLISHGIGVDCSGFVSHAIQYVMGQLKMDFDTQSQTIGEYKKEGVLKNHTKDLFSSGKIMGKAKELKITNKTISILKSGDVMGSSKHIKIIYGVGKDEKGDYYLVADSSTSKKEKTIVDPDNSNNIIIKEGTKKMTGVKLEKHHSIEKDFRYARPRFFDDYYGTNLFLKK